jgi:hypothetical protein
MVLILLSPEKSEVQGRAERRLWRRTAEIKPPDRTLGYCLGLLNHHEAWASAMNALEFGQ